MHSSDGRLAGKSLSPRDFSKPTIAILFVAALAIASIPILTHTLLPLSDYVNHLGRTYIINHIDNDPDLARFYNINWQLVPNLMIDLAMYVLSPAVDIYRAGQIYTIAVFALILGGALTLHRVLFGNWSEGRR